MDLVALQVGDFLHSVLGVLLSSVTGVACWKQMRIPVPACLHTMQYNTVPLSKLAARLQRQPGGDHGQRINMMQPLTHNPTPLDVTAALMNTPCTITEPTSALLEGRSKGGCRFTGSAS